MAEVVAPPKPEVKPPSSPPKEPVKTEKPTAAAGGARSTLEKIASGTPVSEATAPPENLPSRETVDALLSEGNQILLELRDMRLWVNGIATQAADTPLGNELRYDALRSLLAVNAKKLEPLQKKIRALPLPEPKPQESALLTLSIPEEIKNHIRTGNAGSAEMVSHMLQTNNEMARVVWKEITGVDGFTKLNPSPGVLLDLSGIPKTPENMKKATELFGAVAKMKSPPKFGSEQIIMGIMYGAMGMQFFVQLAMPESTSGGGH